MSNEQKEFLDSEIHAFIDNQLDNERASELMLAMADDPKLQKRVDDYTRINAILRSELDPTISEPLPKKLEDQLNRFAQESGERFSWRPVLQAAMISGVMLFSGGTGWTIATMSQAPGQHTLVKSDLIEPAAFAYTVYTPDAARPVEIAASNETLLNRWLTNRMKTPIRAPDLSDSGYTLLGGRLLPSTNRMAAQFMYEDEQGARVTIYVRRIDETDRGVSYADVDGVGSFYWTAGGFGYAVSAKEGLVAKESLLSVSESIYNSNCIHARKRSIISLVVHKLKNQFADILT